MQKKYRAALIGCGGMGEAHIQENYILHMYATVISRGPCCFRKSTVLTMLPMTTGNVYLRMKLILL